MIELGEFTDARGIVRQCIIKKRLTSADHGLLEVDYCKDGEKIKGAIITELDFRPSDYEPEQGAREPADE